ncbi:MAG: class I SAM-dependent methyltransferase [Opitutaceae bacterium]|nr:class I SAM-dependent methyltransferase [Opitutaceae bacterium]
MKVRDSGMPEANYWESLFEIEPILDTLGINADVTDAVEVGCGYGTFTLPVAQRIRGTLHSFDIESSMVAQTRTRLANAGVSNVSLHERDVIADGFALPPGSVDAVLLFNILHVENPIELLRASAELLRSGGRVLIIHWRSDIKTPRGPDLSIRPRPEHVMEWARHTGVLSPAGTHRILPPWHFGLTLQRIG